MPRYDLWALDNRIEGKEKNIPDVVLCGVWQRMCAEKRNRAFFWGGQVIDESGWLDFIKSPRNCPVFVIDTILADVVMFAILNGISGHIAQGHFCGIGQYHRGIGETVLNFWAGLKGTDEVPLLDTIWGITPSVFPNALRLIKLIGFVLLGEMPHMCHINDSEYNQTVPGVISYLDLKEYRNGK